MDVAGDGDGGRLASGTLQCLVVPGPRFVLVSSLRFALWQMPRLRLCDLDLGN